MKFENFLKIYKNIPLIDSSTFSLYDNPVNLRRQVRDWVKKGYLLPLKRGLYIFSDLYRDVYPPVSFIANFMIMPSYVSMEYALGEVYNLIPEKVAVITSVSTKKTQEFSNCRGFFEYHSIKENLFFGYSQQMIDKQKVFIALPEKALLDYFYFNCNSKADFDYFESMRLQNMEKINFNLLLDFKMKYNNRVKKIVDALCEYNEVIVSKYREL